MGVTKATGRCFNIVESFLSMEISDKKFTHQVQQLKLLVRESVLNEMPKLRRTSLELIELSLKLINFFSDMANHRT
jgi:hypothetical protein